MTISQRVPPPAAYRRDREVEAAELAEATVADHDDNTPGKTARDTLVVDHRPFADTGWRTAGDAKRYEHRECRYGRCRQRGHASHQAEGA